MRINHFTYTYTYCIFAELRSNNTYLKFNELSDLKTPQRCSIRTYSHYGYTFERTICFKVTNQQSYDKNQFCCQQTSSLDKLKFRVFCTILKDHTTHKVCQSGAKTLLLLPISLSLRPRQYLSQYILDCGDDKHLRCVADCNSLPDMQR